MPDFKVLLILKDLYRTRSYKKCLSLEKHFNVVPQGIVRSAAAEAHRDTRLLGYKELKARDIFNEYLSMYSLAISNIPFRFLCRF
jgi:hypothetical protein